ncbi:MAG TPA: four helix bundle protein [Vicinamibacterales bacterium]|nr:four helix bundle protein [Vicinamibacterales bacterium]
MKHGQILPRFGPRSAESFGNPRGEFLEARLCMPSEIIAERAFEFGYRIIKLCERLWERGRAARRLADQLFDSGTSIGANAEEAQGGYTKPDFKAKLAVAKKESFETLY